MGSFHAISHLVADRLCNTKHFFLQLKQVAVLFVKAHTDDTSLECVLCDDHVIVKRPKITLCPFPSVLFKTNFGISAMIPEEEQEAYLEDLWNWALSRYRYESQEDLFRLPGERVVIHACKPRHPQEPQKNE